MNWDRFFKGLSEPLFTLGRTTVSLASLLQFLAILIVVIAFAGFARRWLRARLLARSKLDVGLQDAIARFVSYAVLVLGCVIALDTLGVDLSSLKVVAGALGVGIGFGLQNIVNNFVSGLIILAERPIQIGHRVVVGDTEGQVTRIGARSTSILTNDNITIIVPNADIVSTRMINWDHGGDPRVRFHVTVDVGYGSDVRLVEKLLLEVAAGNSHVLKDPPPSVVFKEFGDNALSFDLRVWSADIAHHPSALKSQLNFDIWDRFQQHGIEIPFPQRDLHVKEPLRVELTPGKDPVQPAGR